MSIFVPLRVDRWESYEWSGAQARPRRVRFFYFQTELKVTSYDGVFVEGFHINLTL